MRADAPSEPYYHVRFRWKRISNSSELIAKLKQDFTLTLHAREAEEGKLYDWSPYTGHRWEILAKADTLSAFLSEWRVVLFQKLRAPFTPRDLKLRMIVVSLYPYNRPSPFPGLSTEEPPFEVEPP